MPTLAECYRNGWSSNPGIGGRVEQNMHFPLKRYMTVLYYSVTIAFEFILLDKMHFIMDYCYLVMKKYPIKWNKFRLYYLKKHNLVYFKENLP